jgi:putative ABC transport system permease protein
MGGEATATSSGRRYLEAGYEVRNSHRAAGVGGGHPRPGIMDNFLSDLRYATRGLIRAPGVALIAVVALALGIGLTTVMFSIVYGAMYRGLPFEDAERIMVVRVEQRAAGDQLRVETRIHDYFDWSARQRSFEDLGAFYSGTVNVTSGERPERYSGGFLTGNALAILGAQPVLGRAFVAEDSRPDAPMTLLLGHRAWRDHYGSDPGVLGRTVKVNGEIGTVIGVMPEGFLFPSSQEVWVPLRLDPLTIPRDEGQTVSVFGKLRTGISLDAANAELVQIAQAVASEHSEPSEGIVPMVRPFTKDALGDDEGRTLYAMLATVGLVLLIACANVANLLLARAAVRSRDVAIRAPA